MLNFRNFSIKNKLILIQLITAFTVIIFFGVFLIYNDYKTTKISEIRSLTTIANIIGSNSISAINFLDPDAATDVLNTLESVDGITNGWIYNTNGELFASFNREGFSDLEAAFIENESVIESERFIVSTHKIMQQEELIGTVSLRLKMPDLTDKIIKSAIGALIVMIIGLLTALLLSVFMQKTISNPILDLVHAAEGLAKDANYDVKIVKKYNDEIGTLATAFEEMVRKLLDRERELEKLSKVFMNAADPIIIEDLDGIVVDMNDEAESSYGWSRKELIGKPIKTIVPSDRHSQADEFLNRCKEGDLVRNFEGLRCTKDGKTVPVLLTLSLLKDKDGQAMGVATIAKDISDQKKAEKKLRDYQENLENMVKERTAELSKLNQAVEQSPSTVVITDKEGNIEYVNKRFEEITGYSFNEAVGNNPRVLKSGKIPESVYKDLWTTISSGKIWTGELINKKKNGEEFWESASISPIFNDDKEITHYVAVKDDITERKNAEEALKEREETFRGITTAAQSAIIMASHDGKIYFWNRAAEEMFRYSKEEATGKDMHRLLAPKRYVEKGL
ncbi:PAS domain S-box protein, partial [candidate division KSB1 bacterium]